VITGEDVADATVGADPSTGRPTVTLAFSSEGAQRFEEVTRSHIGRLLSIVLDDRIESSPVIQTAIAGGRALITLGATPAGGPEAQRRQAESLVTALRHGALQGRWTKTSVRQLD
jgi:preprotein translocase subunit SecD